METSGSNRGRSKIKPPIKIFVKRKKDRYCRRGVAKILEEKTIPRFLFDILHHQGKLDLSCDNTLFTVQAIDPFEKTNPLRFEKNVLSPLVFPITGMICEPVCIVSSQSVLYSRARTFVMNDLIFNN